MFLVRVGDVLHREPHLDRVDDDAAVEEMEGHALELLRLKKKNAPN